MKERVFKPDVLNELMDKAGVSLNTLSDALDIQQSTLKNYMSATKQVDPSLNVVVKLADFFNIPVDILLGRTTQEQYEKIMSDYSANFLKLIKPDYERNMVKRSGNHDYIFPKAPNDYIAPYPYNLIDTVFSKPVDAVMTEDRELGLKAALDSLSIREKDCIKMYYEQAMTLDQIGAIIEVTRERARQIILKGIRKLRHPSRATLIMYGLNGTKEVNEWETILAQKLENYRRKVIEWDANSSAVDNRLKELGIDAKSEMQEIRLTDMDLGVRAFNAIARHFILEQKDCRNISLDDICKLVQNPDEFMRVRNIGPKTQKEILLYLKNIYGIDYCDKYPNL